MQDNTLQTAGTKQKDKMKISSYECIFTIVPSVGVEQCGISSGFRGAKYSQTLSRLERWLLLAVQRPGAALKSCVFVSCRGGLS